MDAGARRVQSRRVPTLADVLIPPRLLLRAFDDLHAVAQVATEMPHRLDELEQRADALLKTASDAFELLERLDGRARELLELGGRIDGRAEEILGLGERIDERGAAIVELGEKIDGRGGEILEMGERMNALGHDIEAEGVLIHTRAEEVAARAAEMIAVLPTLERAVAIATPLEGAVERLGRMVDRLPGEKRKRAEAKQALESAAGVEPEPSET